MGKIAKNGMKLPKTVEALKKMKLQEKRNTKTGRLFEDGSNKSRSRFRVSLLQIVHSMLLFY